MDDAPKEFVKVELLDCGETSMGSYIDRPEAVGEAMKHEIEHLPVGDAYRLTKILMTEKEFAKLPEFTGF